MPVLLKFTILFHDFLMNYQFSWKKALFHQPDIDNSLYIAGPTSKYWRTSVREIVSIHWVSEIAQFRHKCVVRLNCATRIYIFVSFIVTDVILLNVLLALLAELFLRL